MKKVIYLSVGLIISLVIAGVALLVLVDPNQFKPLIIEQVKKNTGRELIIDGNISWQFWPIIGFSIERVEFRNPSGFAEDNLIKLDSANLSISVLPLLSERLEIGVVSLHGARLFVQTLAEGHSNLDGLSIDKRQKGADDSAESESGQSPSPSDWAIAIGGIELVGASMELRDDNTQIITEINDLNFHLDAFDFNQWGNATFSATGRQNELSFSVEGEAGVKLHAEVKQSALRNVNIMLTLDDGNNTVIEEAILIIDHLAANDESAVSFSVKGRSADLTIEAEASTNLTIDEAVNEIAVSNLNLRADLAGEQLPQPEMQFIFTADAIYNVAEGFANLPAFAMTVANIGLKGRASLKNAEIPMIRFSAESERIDIDEFLGVVEKEETKADTGKKIVTLPSDVEPDLSVLKALDIAGQVKVGFLKASQIIMTGIDVDVAVDRGLVTLKRLKGTLYEGSIDTQAVLDVRPTPATFTVKKKIEGVQLKPLLEAVAQVDFLSGAGHINADLSGTGLSEKKIRQNLKGQVAIELADGAVAGFNPASLIRQAKALLTGRDSDQAKEARQTDFSSLTGDIDIANGIAQTDNIEMFSPALRLRASGNTHLLQETLDFNLSASLVGSSQGQGGKDVDALRDITFPIEVGGFWHEPTYSIDTKALLKANTEAIKDKIEKKAVKGLEKLIKGGTDSDSDDSTGKSLLKLKKLF